MYKEIFKRMLPVIIGSILGVFIVGTLFYLLELEDIHGAVKIAFITFVLYVIIQFFFTRKAVIAKKLAEHIIITPLPIVYIGEKGPYSKPYFDLDKCHEVWGIAVEKTYFQMVNAQGRDNARFTFDDVYSICRKALLSSQPMLFLPSCHDLYSIRKYRLHFDATVTILNLFGVKAENWLNGRYLCLDDVVNDTPNENGYNSQKVCSMNIAPNQNPELRDITSNEACFVRFITQPF